MFMLMFLLINKYIGVCKIWGNKLAEDCNRRRAAGDKERETGGWIAMQ